MTSDATCVPPVTADRSPPASRITGADSPVIAASFTDATPSMTSPSLGMISPALTSTTSFCRSDVAGMTSTPPSAFSRFAVVSVLACCSVLAACALPRPSATASAKLANSTVNHSQILICSAKPRWPVPVNRSRRNRIVVKVETISTTNITGLRQRMRGSSFRKAWPMAGQMMDGSSREVEVRAVMCGAFQEEERVFFF